MSQAIVLTPFSSHGGNGGLMARHDLQASP
jgi:hypothetical protein